MAPLKVLISGAGIAGQTLAFWLSRLGHSVTIIERFPALRSGGQQLDFRGSAMDVVRKMGLEPAIRAKNVHEDGAAIVDEVGRKRAVFLANTSGKGRSTLTTDCEIMRHDLCDILYSATAGSTTYRFGTSVASVSERPADSSGVTVQLSDGTHGNYDLVVGADGQNSRTRRYVLGPGASEGDTSNSGVASFHSLGLFAAWCSVPRTPEVDALKLMRFLHAPGHRAVATRHDNRPDRMQAYLFMKPDLADVERYRAALAGGPDAQKALLVEEYRDVGWEVPHILRNLATSPDFYMQEVGQVRAPAWSRGAVGVVGDAAYCPSPMTGMGTTSALLGAYVLAGEISKVPNDVPVALKNYEKTFRPFVQKAQELPPGTGAMLPKTAAAIGVLRAVFAAAAALKVDRIVQAISPGDGGGWALPEYPALEADKGARETH